MNPPQGAARAGRPAVAPSLPSILAPVEDDLRQVESELGRCLAADDEIIRTMGRYVSEGGGKRIRPALLLLCARMAGYRGERHVLFATVFELIHTATLVHDDVIDDAKVRRGRSTVHERWGTNLTVLFGDWLYLRAMNAALTADDLRQIKILCDITLEMIEGEIVQSHVTGRMDVTESEHLDVMRRKTALLFSGCARVAGVLAGLAPGRVEDLAGFGMNLGMAYQIVDDLLDFTADPAVLGKPVASDLREGRLTLPLIYLLQKGEARHAEMIRWVLEDREFKRVSLGDVVAEIERHGALERARRLAARFADDARTTLMTFPEGPARRSLLDVCEFITARSY